MLFFSAGRGLQTGKFFFAELNKQLEIYKTCIGKVEKQV